MTENEVTRENRFFLRGAERVKNEWLWESNWSFIKEEGTGVRWRITGAAILLKSREFSGDVGLEGSSQR